MKQDYSVIVPVHNGEKFIIETLTSIDNQSFAPFEIIVVDDCSTDTTPILVKRFAEKSNITVKFIQLEVNSGSAARPRNKGLDVVGDVKYIAFCDADDVWHVEKMAIQLSFMEQEDSMFSFGGVKFFNLSSEIVFQKISGNSRVLNIKNFRFNNCIKSCSTAVINKSIARYCEFPEGIRYRGIEDYYCWLGILSRIDRVDMLTSNLTFYRQHQASISSSKLNMVKLRYKTFGFKKSIFSESSIYLPNIIISELIYVLKQVMSKL